MNVQSISGLATQLKYATDDERVALVAAIQEKESHLRVLNNFAVSVIGITKQEELLWFVAKEVVGQLGFEDCVIYTLDKADQVLVQQAAVGAKSPNGEKIVNPMHIPLGIGVTGKVAAQAMPLIVNDLSRFPDYVADISPAGSEICVPLHYNGQVMGVIDCEHPEKRFFNSDHLEILTSVAAMTSSKIKELEFVGRLEEQNRSLKNKHQGQHSDSVAPVSKAPETEDVSSNFHILIAEDNEVNQIVISRLVKLFGWTSDVVANGQEAVDVLSSNKHYDLVLMDIRMPIMDGVTATRTIRSNDNDHANIPIIAVTANAHQDDAAEYLSAGMNAVVPKPIDKDKLQRAITSLVSQSA